MDRHIVVTINRPVVCGANPSKGEANINIEIIPLHVDLYRRVVDIPELGEVDLDSVIRLADTLRIYLDAYRTGLIKPCLYGPEDRMVMRWLHEYMHRMGLED